MLMYPLIGIKSETGNRFQMEEKGITEVVKSALWRGVAKPKSTVTSATRSLLGSSSTRPKQ